VSERNCRPGRLSGVIDLTIAAGRTRSSMGSIQLEELGRHRRCSCEPRRQCLRAGLSVPNQDTPSARNISGGTMHEFNVRSYFCSSEPSRPRTAFSLSGARGNSAVEALSIAPAVGSVPKQRRIGPRNAKFLLLALAFASCTGGRSCGCAVSPPPECSSCGGGCTTQCQGTEPCTSDCLAGCCASCTGSPCFSR
jgi:hypothetical protein